MYQHYCDQHYNYNHHHHEVDSHHHHFDEVAKQVIVLILLPLLLLLLKIQVLPDFFSKLSLSLLKTLAVASIDFAIYVHFLRCCPEPERKGREKAFGLTSESSHS